MGDPNAEEAVLLIHGFGANTNHWRSNQPVLAELLPTYAIDLLGFGRSDQPRARLKDEPVSADAVHYGFDLWGLGAADGDGRRRHDRRLLLGDRLEGGAEVFDVIQSDGGEGQNVPLGVDCGRIESPPEPHLDDGQLHLRFSKGDKGRHGD